MSLWGTGLFYSDLVEMARQDREYLAKKRVEEDAKNASSQSFTAGDAKKGAGLFKVSI
jgi:hypothetical protein